MQLERDTYHLEHCRFSVAFFKDDQRLLPIYGTRWNWLDIADLCTGERLSERLFDVAPGEKYLDHYLDYFHGRLRVSPDQQWIVDDGWMWHPVGSMFSWNLQHWLHDNPWESEDGLSMLELCSRVWYWDGPLCWINEHVVAI